MTEKYILSLDQGTTSSRSVLFNKEGKLIDIHQVEFKQHYPQAGWVEHDPFDILNTQLTSACRLIKKCNIQSSQIAGIGITNQRETIIVWDKITHQPIYPAIVWQCRRTSSFCQQLVTNGHASAIRSKTGLEVDAYFSASKIHWILENVQGAREKANNGQLAFGTVDSWIIYNLTGGKSHITDMSNASRTMLFNINTKQWDAQLFQLFDIPQSMSPTVTASSGQLAVTSFSSMLVNYPEISQSIPITGILGDQQAALFGQQCFDVGQSKNTYGTGCFLLVNTGQQVKFSTSRLLTSIAWTIDQQTTYCLEGSVFMGGAIIQWLRDELQLIEKSSDSEPMALSVPNSNNVYIVPAFTGLGAPYWDSLARGIITGLTRGCNKRHIVRAALEAIAYQSADLVKAMERDLQHPISILKCDGGASTNKFLMQFQSDLLQIPVQTQSMAESTALGVAFMAGLGSGIWASTDAIRQLPLSKRLNVFAPQLDKLGAEKNYQGWKHAIYQCQQHKQTTEVT